MIPAPPPPTLIQKEYVLEMYPKTALVKQKACVEFIQDLLEGGGGGCKDLIREARRKLCEQGCKGNDWVN